MKKEIPPAVFVAVLAVVLIVVGVVLYPKIAGGPTVMDARSGPPAELMKNQPPSIYGKQGPTSLNPGQSRVNAGAGGTESPVSPP
jgi:hypothetical protein